MDYVITIPTDKRVNSTIKVINGIKSCYGHEKYKIIVCANPGSPEVIDAIKENKGNLNLEIIMNSHKFPTGDNVYQCLYTGFELSDFVIVFEDDIVPSKDCLNFIEYCRFTYKDDPDIFNVSCYNRRPIENHELYTIERWPWLTCWGWGTWIDRWENDIKYNWWTVPEDGNWTYQINLIRGERKMIRPSLSRTQNVGYEDSVHQLTEEKYMEHQHTPWWVGYMEHDFKNGEYREQTWP